MTRRAPLPVRLARLPGLWLRHYRLLRHNNGRAVSAWSAWRMAWKLIAHTYV